MNRHGSSKNPSPNNSRLVNFANKLVIINIPLMFIVFLPQIFKLLETKNAAGIAVWTFWISFVMQTILLFQHIVTKQITLTLNMLMSIIPLLITIALIYAYS